MTKLEAHKAAIEQREHCVQAESRNYDEQDKHCRECICPSCDTFKTADCLYGPDSCKKCDPDSHVGYCWCHPSERKGYIFAESKAAKYGYLYFKYVR